ncbi:hypothetical protein [Rhizobium leguminosarum]|uniref:hypothetical protein n=1 Tax=Rhizobium leguminosarum TaxID=384 RepID=UPI001C902016|nr:hypothetical protein [Rhizobium leguminosarum]MBY2913614.1 hypothetical protein [Rhizobium leguminosarum]MBY2969151.1 hypothetical protein [Rhizobium leguminosarum]MBY3005075.1 hypothetical protein [Rhizobium leguminosarum]
MNLHIHKSGEAAPADYDVLIGQNGESRWRGGGRAKGRLIILVEVTVKGWQLTLDELVAAQQKQEG